MSVRLGFGLLLAIWLGGCAGWRPPVSARGQEELAWLESLPYWQLQGRVGVRAEQGSWHGSLDWIYRDGQDRLVIFGPLGQGKVVIQARADWVRIEKTNGQVQVSDRPQSLLKEALGVAVPLQALHYWIRGLSAPGEGEVEFGPDGRIIRLRQQGWQVEYHEYRSVGSYALPVKLSLTGPRGVHLKLIVDRWEVDVEPKRA
ncbi:lipoprotein insertase outer membrane protein LolB [Methylothermus subterraneus]